MSDTDQMLRAIINEQSDLKQELLKKIEEVDIKLGGVEERLGKKIDKVEGKVLVNTKRLDKIGSQLAYLEDDTPTNI
ncbi:hypothetical protein COW99_00925 [Candidatus Roizmanbacteria bacterium CG22_combo_CG10-13_8_21_14_all_38_20]|uniref:Uncharacterized protein n=1 Tax=Candidatus Roizmanbacteria bacterium CG22_combo_CG10-13_8_21_14_all_38_20 TaxID=1974862 RepID=A0A2H0BWH2_9BACT|nr:hypothetical protein [Candidatus Microgenomates bacterium]PIP62027.1 MAG: hypothetical protein COW99_00925 [Candidatus Roizmanbacteria bacterium CG22_combo_CG10-13_8_21_14_all_38_20]PJC31668.1 MAG: hypothetical protein CO050_02555 [Candidatus Roizmanbacteria bacterium CG_4_9_14_0_2_um_filter_38_17]